MQFFASIRPFLIRNNGVFMRTKSTITAADAATILAACKIEAEKNQWKVSIAVVDDAGHLVHIERADGAPFQSPEIARRKAFTACAGKQPTKFFEDMVKERPAIALMPDRLPLQGGVPIIHNGECVGGIGVSGVKSHEDEIVAIAGLNALLAKA
jgi:glc operon protein GlcG